MSLGNKNTDVYYLAGAQADHAQPFNPIDQICEDFFVIEGGAPSYESNRADTFRATLAPGDTYVTYWRKFHNFIDVPQSPPLSAQTDHYNPAVAEAMKHLQKRKRDREAADDHLESQLAKKFRANTILVPNLQPPKSMLAAIESYHTPEAQVQYAKLSTLGFIGPANGNASADDDDDASSVASDTTDDMVDLALHGENYENAVFGIDELDNDEEAESFSDTSSEGTSSDDSSNNSIKSEESEQTASIVSNQVYTLLPKNRMPTFDVSDLKSSSIMSRLPGFLTQMKSANEQLEAEKTITGASSRKIEIDDNEVTDGQYIEMNLGLGVLEEKNGDDSSSDSSDSSDSKSGDGEQVMEKLMGAEKTDATDKKVIIEEL